MPWCSYVDDGCCMFSEVTVSASSKHLPLNMVMIHANQSNGLMMALRYGVLSLIDSLIHSMCSPLLSSPLTHAFLICSCHRTQSSCHTFLLLGIIVEGSRKPGKEGGGLSRNHVGAERKEVKPREKR